MKKIRIAIDGPAGAGKSSVSKLVASKLNYSYVDTGAIYRSLALAAAETDGECDSAELAEIINHFNVSFKMIDGINHVYLNGGDVTNEIRNERISMLASKIAKIPFVREALFRMQRELGEEGGVVMEGRDIGTVIMPDAELKIYLTATPEHRAKRRALELEAKGVSFSMQQLVSEIRDRDRQDMTREVAPLRQAEDAVVVDNSDMNLEETAEKIVQLARERE